MRKITLVFTIAFTLASLTSYAKPLQGQSSQTPSNIFNSTQVGFKQPDYQGDAPSGRDRGTGSRGDCTIAAPGEEGEITLTPLIPSDSRGLTLQESPTVWVQVDYKSKTIGNQLLGEFSLEDAQTSIKFPPKRLSVKLPQTTNVFGIPIPQSLEINKWYRWYLVLDCDSQQSSNNDSVLAIEGIVQRVSRPKIENQLNSQSPQERIATYTEEGIWYDALKETAILRCSNPQNATLGEPWTALLRDVGLDKVALTPLICLE